MGPGAARPGAARPAAGCRPALPERKAAFCHACKAKNIDRLVALYSPGIVYYDVVPPIQFVGSADVRRNFMRWFDEYDGPIGLQTHDLDIAANSDVAFAHMLHLDSGTRKNGPDMGTIDC
jgi:ketosteroid isomerase-like protein